MGARARGVGAGAIVVLLCYERRTHDLFSWLSLKRRASSGANCKELANDGDTGLYGRKNSREKIPRHRSRSTTIQALPRALTCFNGVLRSSDALSGSLLRDVARESQTAGSLSVVYFCLISALVSEHIASPFILCSLCR